MALTWTQNRVLIFNLLDKMTPAQIYKKYGIPYSSITPVVKARQEGDFPEGEKPAELDKLPENKEKTSNDKQSSLKVSEKEKAPPKIPVTKYHGPTKPELDIATLGKMAPVVVQMQFTPIMYSARYFLMRELGWPRDVRWEDIIDTVFYKYFKGAYGVVLQGYYRIDEEKPVSTPAEPAKTVPQSSGDGGGDTDALLAIDTESPAFKKLSNLVTMQILKIAGEAKAKQAEAEAESPA